MNRVDNINEFLLGMITLQLIFFTDWIYDDTLQFELGWVIIISIFGIILFNLSIVLYYELRQIYLIYSKY